MSLAVALAACGGGSQAVAPPPPPPVQPSAALVSLSPTSVIAAGSDFTLIVNGSNFISSATVFWNGQSVPTKFVSGQQVTATIAESLISSAEVVTVTVQNALSSVSNGLQFSVNNPAPQITSISPDNVMAGSPPVVLTINGSGFEAATYLLINGSAQPPQSQTPTQLQVTIPSNQLATATSLTISAANLAPAAGPSNQVALTVTPFTSNPAPALTSALDPSVPAGWPGFQLTVNGANFVTASVLQWNGIDRPTTVVSSTELTAAIPADLLVSPGAAQVSVSNPSPGGGASGALPIQIQAIPPGAIGVIERSDIGNDLSEPNSSSYFPAVSGDGRFVVFVSYATNLVPDDTSSAPNIFLRDTCIGATAGCVPSGTLLLSNPPAGESFAPAISANGQFISYSSLNTVYLENTCAGVPAGCVPAIQQIYINEDYEVGQGSLSSDGRFVAFLSGRFGCWDGYDGCDLDGQVFLADTCAGVASGCTPSSQAIAPSIYPYATTPDGLILLQPSVSPDGRFVVFNTSDHDISLFDSCQGAPAGCTPSTTLVSAASDGSPANAYGFGGASSAGGRFVAFLSAATNLVPGTPTPGVLRVYLRDTCIGAPAGCTPATTSIAVAGDGAFGDFPSISADGRYIAFDSQASDLVPGDTNGVSDVFVSDTCSGVSSGCTPSIVRVSVSLEGTQGNGVSFTPAISADGRFVVFTSAAKLGPGSQNPILNDVYLARH